MQRDKSEIFKCKLSAKYQTPSYRRHFQCVVFAQISLRTINSFAFIFLFSEIGVQIWLATFD